MTLNASGPISLGGATTGQSINLELGVSATALASINSTPFRTLAGVSSGTIALSNFYGKSNESSWILYLGPAKTPALSTPLGSFLTNHGWDVSTSGLLAVPIASSANGANSRVNTGVRWVDSAGTTTGLYDLNPVPTGVDADPTQFQQTYQGYSTNYLMVRANSNNLQNPVIFGATNSNTYMWPTWKKLYSSSGLNNVFSIGVQSMTDASGNFVIGNGFSDKAGFFGECSRVTNAGSGISSLGFYPGARVLSFFPRSDGTYAAIAYQGSSGLGLSGSSYYTINSSFSSSTNVSLYDRTSAEAYFQSFTWDGVNNIAWAYGRNGNNSSDWQGQIIRFGANTVPTVTLSYTCPDTGFKMYGNSGSNTAQLQGLSYYGGNLWMGAYDFTNREYYIVKLNPTTLAVVYAFSMRFEDPNFAGFYYYGQFGLDTDTGSVPSIKASSAGVHMCFPLYSVLDSGSAYSFKFLANTAPTPGTYSVPSSTKTGGGTTYNLVITSRTITTTARTVPTRSTTTYTVSNFSGNQYSFGQTIGTVSNTVTPTLTTIP